jgi:hypothetical protein
MRITLMIDTFRKMAGSIALGICISVAAPSKIRFTGAVDPFPLGDFPALSSAFTLSLNPISQALFSLRIMGGSQNPCEKCDYRFDNDGKVLQAMTEYALLAGYTAEFKRLSLSGSAGPAYVFGKEMLPAYSKYKVPGAALDARALIMLNRTFGIGVQGFMDLNSEQSIYGAMFALEVRLW